MKGARVVALVAVAWVGCAGPEASPSLSVGEVRDALTGRPIEGALVRAAGREEVLRTDARGRFVADPHRAVHAEAPGYLAAWRPDPGLLELWPEAPDEAAVDEHLARLEVARALRDDPSDPALRPAARAFLRGEITLDGPSPNGDVGSVRAALDAPPETIRIWRRSLDENSTSCSGRVDVIPFEDYIKGVLPHEWISSWHDESLRAGALTIRTYAWNWVRRGGKYECADLDDTARSQVYRDARVERASRAVDDTRGVAISRNGALVSGEYSAENGDPTAHGVSDPLCTGREVFGHGRGMCQWGSQRWALDGRDHAWIAVHYFPGSILEGATPPLLDYDAVLVAGDAPETLRAGERAEVWVELENTGLRTWEVGATRLGVPGDAPSAFHDADSWPSPTRATPPDAPDYGTGSVGRFTFSIVAPSVPRSTMIEERFALVADDVYWFGPEVVLRVRVEPSDAPDAGRDDPFDDAGGGASSLTGGCSVGTPAGAGPAWALAALALLALRRRR